LGQNHRQFIVNPRDHGNSKYNLFFILLVVSLKYLEATVFDILHLVPAAMAPHQAGNKKRRREPSNVDTKLVEIYEDLANEKDEIRLKAAQALVSQFTPDVNPTDEQIKKVLERLFRGLCSSRKAARIGFSIALTEVLTQVLSEPRESSEIDIPRVVRFWEAQSNAAGGESGQVCTKVIPCASHC
jgi:hypothetical protein